ncbi:MAG: FlgD immunoglobulin-like domain containing protein [Candidatus Latescibacterota bacterium]|jgi:hypothetical protein
MTRFAVLVLLLAAAPVQAITWNFDTEGDAQGWVARDGQYGDAITAAPLHTEVRDGIWRITSPAFTGWDSPAILLQSPTIGKDSALFDRLRLRLRMVHSRPFEAGCALLWRNSTNADEFPGGDPPQDPAAEQLELYYEVRWHQTFTTEWQEVQVSDLRTYEGTTYGGAAGQWKTVWEGVLFELALRLNIYPSELYPIQTAGQTAEALEIDWIQLTGVEEQLEGEGQPPAAEELVPFGERFAPAVYCPLGKAVSSTPWIPMAALGDIDGDNDLDLVSTWWETFTQGWLVATNDGQGSFTSQRVEACTQPFYLGGQDLNGDGQLDLVLRAGTPDLRLLLNRAQEGWVPAQDFPGARYLGLGDQEGDGDSDLWAFSDAFDQVLVWVNDGTGRFAGPKPFGADQFARGYLPFMPVAGLRGGRVTGLLWRPPPGKLGQGYEVTYLGTDGDVVAEHLATAADPLLLHYAGDFDHDGDVDLVLSRTRNNSGANIGLELLVNPGDGQMVTVPWLDQTVALGDVVFLDLNGDEVLDPVFVASDARGAAVLVFLGQREAAPVPDGRYLLAGRGGAVLCGDVNGDGALDLVVLESAPVGGGIAGMGGVQVLLGQGLGQNTAVLAPLDDVQPAAFHLGPSYPNPFNPQTWIPFEVPVSAEPGQLRIYNLLGQPIRTLVAGPLTPGYHAVPWDGRDESGVAVTSGVYLYRLEAGAWRATGRMVKNK